jgi:hypothetical protein
VYGVIGLTTSVLCASGCAIHYFDPATGTEHLWGFGHMKMKVAAPNEGLQAVVHGTGTVGIALGTLERQSYFHVGVQRRERLDVVDEDTAIRFEWPTNDLFHVRVGSEFPKEFVEAEVGEKDHSEKDRSWEESRQ